VQLETPLRLTLMTLSHGSSVIFNTRAYRCPKNTKEMFYL
jgi:hypothetical protein